MLNRGGACIANAKLDIPRVLRFQINLMKMQMALEDFFTEMAADLYPEKKIAILSDRGVMDGSAYMTKPMWQALLDETGWSNSQLRDQRYDMVLHLVTAADGAKEYYSTDSNESRYEGIEEAIATDRKTQISWLGHPSFTIIDNSLPGFNNKIQRCMEQIYILLDLPRAATFYKKLLLRTKKTGDTYLGDAISYFDVEDTYLIAKQKLTEEKISSRVRFDDSDNAQI